MVVLTILALLAGIVIFVVKPGNILDNVKDATRVSDLNNISKSINYLNTIQLGLLNLGSPTTVYVSLPDNTSTTCSSYALPSLPTGYTYTCKNSTDYRKNDGNGWVPINFRESDNSNILSSLPVDPTNNITYYYTYFPGGSFELTAQLTKARDSSLNDNGNSTLLYETGTPNHVASPIVRETNLVGYWTLSEGTGVTTADKSGHNNYGTLTGGSPIWTTLTSGEMTLNFNAGPYAYLGMNGISYDLMSVSLWVNFTSPTGQLGNGAIIFGSEYWSNNNFAITQHSDNYKVMLTVGSNDFYNLNGSFSQIGTWYHYVFSYDSKKTSWATAAKAYVNGVVWTNLSSGGAIETVKTSATIRMAGGSFNGIIDDVRFYNRVLTAEEVMTIYNKTKGRYQ